MSCGKCSGPLYVTVFGVYKNPSGDRLCVLLALGPVLRYVCKHQLCVRLLACVCKQRLDHMEQLAV